MDQSRLEQLITQAKMLMEESRTQAAAALAQKRALSSAARLAKRVRPPWTEEVDRKIAELVESGSNWPQIGEALGRPYSSCYSRWYTVLEPSLKNVWTGEAIIRLNKLAKQGKGWTEIGQELKIRPLACRAKWSQLGKARSPLAISSSLTAIPLHTEGSDLGDSYSSTSEDESSEGTRSAKTKAIAFSETESALILQLAKEHGPDQWHIVLEEFRKQLLGSTLSTTSPSSPEAEHKDAKARARRLAAFDRRSMTITAASLEHQFIRLSRIKDIWTLDQETRLIQQVLRNGTSEEVWSEIAQNSGFHSAQECRTRWKQLDMPVRLNSTPWGKAEQSMFWYLWRHFGPNFNQISKSIVRRSAADCQHFFENATRSVPDPEQDPVLFSQKMQEIQDRLPIPRQKNSFTKERSLRLQLAMRQIGTEIGKRHSDGYYGSWDWVAYMVQPGISKTSCMEHWYYLRRNMDVVEGPLELGKNEVKTAESSSWSHEEAKLLDQGMREFASSWSQIQQRYLPWRTTRAIRQRWWIISDRSLLVDEEEYYKIISAGDAAEEIDFDALAKTMPGWKRSPCRRVFETSYKHLVRTTRWSPEEDQLLLRQVLAVRGRDWNAVASHFHGVQTARATLFGQTAETMTMSPYEIEGLRIQKSAWQCRLRWCQLVEPLMCKEPVLAATEKSHALKASKKLLEA
ncbi:hypothetical protein BGZ83_005121 [Gryganskiella cystojenkinii]|nr:hypothetical protein BGZ83_005121 [Gryganskiella cystojenkinii]